MSANSSLISATIPASPLAELESYYVIPDAEARKQFDQRSTMQSLWDKSLCFFRETGSVVYSSIGLDPKFDPKYANPVWQEESAGLYVLVHGLNASPSEWISHIAEINKTPGFDIYSPEVLNQGNCSLNAAAKPIFDMIVTYTRKHPSKSVCLIGESNGSRLVTWIEVELRKGAPTTPVRISTIAGVFFGSSGVDIIRENPLLHRVAGLSRSVLNELSFGSDRACSLLNAVRDINPKDPERIYDIYAGTEDVLVPNLSLPKFPNIKANYTVLHGYGHLTLMGAVMKVQIAAAKIWFEMQARNLLIRNSIGNYGFSSEALSLIYEY